MVRFLWRGDPRERAGITKLNVVVAIVAIGIAGVIWITMFANNVSNYSDRKLCSYNMVYIGKAIAGYRAANGNEWPMASTKPVDCAPASFRNSQSHTPNDRVAGYSWIVRLLPYLGENPAYKSVAAKSEGFKWSAFDPELVDANGRHFATLSYKVMQCPAFQGNTEINYTSSAPEYQRFAKDPYNAASAVALTNYVAISATHLELVLPSGDREAKPNGTIFFYSPAGKGPTAIPDGDSHTIIVTETREPGYASWYDGTTGWVVAHDPNSAQPVLRDRRWVCDETAGCRSSLATSMDENADGSSEAYFYRKRWAGEAPWRFGPSSGHAGGPVVHLYGDKRVASIQANGPNKIAASVYFALVTRDGSEPDKYDP
jgi:hypothetical protein